MTHELSQRFHFDAAHTLARRVDAEPSRRIHGHTYTAEITIAGLPDPATGMVLDLALLRAEIERVRLQLDHRLLNEVPGLGQPTLEALCDYLAAELGAALPGLCRVAVGRQAGGDRCTLNVGSAKPVRAPVDEL